MISRRWFVRPNAVYIDLADSTRRAAIREAEFQARCDAEARILRVSGKTQAPVRSIPGVTSWERQR